MTSDEKLDKILETLARIEDRQIKTTAKVHEISVQEQPVVGSFATSESRT